MHKPVARLTPHLIDSDQLHQPGGLWTVSVSALTGQTEPSLPRQGMRRQIKRSSWVPVKTSTHIADSDLSPSLFSVV